MDTPALLRRYYSRLIALERKRPLTGETYRTEIRHFLNWLEREEGIPWEQVDPPGISRYMGYRRRVDGIDSRSAAKAVSALRSFFRFLQEERFREDDCASLLESPRRGVRLPRVLEPGEFERVLALIPEGPLGLRNRTIYELIYSGGLRISEAVGINLGDLYLKERMVEVRGKGGKERLALFGQEAKGWLERYLGEVRPLLVKARRTEALFVGRSGKRLTRKGVWKNYAGLAVAAGLGSTKVHTLRHTFATDMLRGGADLRSVQELLGHADLATTQVYTHVDGDLLRESHRRFLPRLGEWVDRGKGSGK